MQNQHEARRHGRATLIIGAILSIGGIILSFVVTFWFSFFPPAPSDDLAGVSAILPLFIALLLFIIGLVIAIRGFFMGAEE